MGSDHPYLHVDQVQHISIHAPRMGSDPPIRAKMTTSHIFQSTPPHGERLTCFLIKAGLINFNPRPRMGSDHHRFGYIPRRSYFNPRPPHGERRQYSQRSRPSDIFQSTPPAWGATTLEATIRGDNTISIHAPRMGSDVSCECISARQAYFNPRSRMGSDVVVVEFFRRESISIHAPAWGATIAIYLRKRRRFISIHAPAWGATAQMSEYRPVEIISIHAPAWGATAF